jgi:hypothetical protein
MNLVFATHFKEIFGLDVISKFNPTPNEIREANKLFSHSLKSPMGLVFE